jgi:hypothetical protein
MTGTCARAAIALSALLAIAACKKAKPAAPPPEAQPLISAMHDFAVRCDACKEDRDCLHALRDEFDTQKNQLIGDGHRLVGDDKTQFDAELLHLRSCGDGGGLTFWVDQ